MSMEFLTEPWHHLFFGKQTEKYELGHAADALTFCAVDKTPRLGVKPSDHTALVAELNLKDDDEKEK